MSVDYVVLVFNGRNTYETYSGIGITQTLQINVWKKFKLLIFNIKTLLIVS